MSSAYTSLRPTVVDLEVDARDPRSALLVAAQCACRVSGRDPAPVSRALWRREQVGSTALGQGIAIPHARIDGLDRRLTLFLRLRSPLDFDAPDGKLVNQLYVILVPADDATDDHLEFLARVAAALSDGPLRSQIASAADPAAVQHAFAAWEEAAQRRTNAASPS